MQREMGLLGDVTPKMRPVEDALVAIHPTEQASFRLCINQSPVRLTHDAIAACLKVSRSALTTMLGADTSKRPRYMPRWMQVELQKLCQNTAIDQWAELYSRGLLQCQRTKEALIEDLERQLAQAKSA